MKIAILGAGRMGGWLAERLGLNHQVGVLDIHPLRTEKLGRVTILPDHERLGDFHPDLIINAVSLQNTLEAYESVLPYLPKDCLISDIASVKGRLPRFYEKSPFRFASVHPMFGPTFAAADRLAGENAIIIRESDPRGADFFRNFFRDLGLKIYEYSFDQHDRMIAYSLALPFASTMVFAACLDNTAVPGTTFKKHFEIAKGLLSEDDYLLSEILFSPYSLAQIENVANRLNFLKRVIEQKDTEEAIRFFNRLRKNLPPGTGSE
jgi:prephenate dehydrogenase